MNKNTKTNCGHPNAARHHFLLFANERHKSKRLAAFVICTVPQVALFHSLLSCAQDQQYVCLVSICHFDDRFTFSFCDGLQFARIMLA